MPVRRTSFGTHGKARRPIFSFVSIAFLAIAGAFADAKAADRVALLLAAQDYQHFKLSAVSVDGTERIGRALRTQGFDVRIIGNPNNATARAALREFARTSEQARFALILAAGHFATFGGQTFYLPTNARIRRATDLFSRGLSVASIADLARRAKHGAILLLATVPDIPSTVAGVGSRPELPDLPENLIGVVSSSSSIPLSRVDRVSAQAARDVAEAAAETPLMLRALVDSASAGGVGRVAGNVLPLNLSIDENAVKHKQQSDAARAQSEAVARAKQEAERLARARLEAERLAKARSAADRKARENAEARLREAEVRARQAEVRARQAEERARQDAQAKAAAAILPKPAEAPPTSETAAVDVQSLQVVESLLGRDQRRVIQRKLQVLQLYNGRIDGVFGELTRKAIMDFQTKIGAKTTGYLTPAQLKQLVATQ